MMELLRKVYQRLLPVTARDALYRTRTTLLESFRPGRPASRERHIPPQLSPILNGLRPLPEQWHERGTLSIRVLEAIAHYLYAIDMPIQHTVETGCGKSTVLLSNISPRHTVFALRSLDNSAQAVFDSPLTRKETIEWVDGFTQKTVPAYPFNQPIQFALIDGPHGYPFPDLEYYALYPHLAEHAILVIDDIHIPTIRNLFDFLRAEDMFRLEEVISTAAIFRRTAAPTFDPTGDGWWKQGYNRKAAEYFVRTNPGLLR